LIDSNVVILADKRRKSHPYIKQPKTPRMKIEHPVQDQIKKILNIKNNPTKDFSRYSRINTKI
jgi:hypothetical protein